MKKLKLFPELQPMEHEFVTRDENDPQISSTDELQIASRSTQFTCVEHTVIKSDDEMDPPQIPTTDEVQQETTYIEQPPTVEVLIDPPQFEGRHLDMPHKYNTRMTAYNKNLSDYIVQEQQLLNRLRKNQQRPTAHVASTPHDQWFHSRYWVNINLLRLNIPIKKIPNYSLTKRYKTRKASYKKVPVTSTTSLGTEGTITTSTMGCAKETSNQQ